MSPSGVNAQILRLGDPLPEGLQLLQPAARRIAGDDRRVDRADRDAGHPVRLDAGFVQRLVDAGLIGAERAAALQHQRDAVASLGPPGALGRGCPPRGVSAWS